MYCKVYIVLYCTYTMSTESSHDGMNILCTVQYSRLQILIILSGKIIILPGKIIIFHL